MELRRVVDSGMQNWARAATFQVWCASFITHAISWTIFAMYRAWQSCIGLLLFASLLGLLFHK